MRAREFINEDKKETHTGIKMQKEFEASLPGAHRVAGTADRHYDLGRIMQYVAGSDGKHHPVIPKESWAGRNNTAHPYTEIESEMLKHAYDVLGVTWDDVLKPNPKNKSIEQKFINVTSPITNFKGFK